MKTKFLAAVVLAMGVLGSSTAPASAWGDWFPGWGMVCGYNRNLNIQVSVPYNAFTPFCAGRSVCHGNCPGGCGNCCSGGGCGNYGGGYGPGYGGGGFGCGHHGFGGGGYGPNGYCPYMGGWGVGGACCMPVCTPCCDPCACDSTAPMAPIAPKASTTSANDVTATPLMAQKEMTVPVEMPGQPMPVMPMTGVPGAMPMPMPMPMTFPMAQPVGYWYPMNYGYYPMHPNYGTYGY